MPSSLQPGIKVEPGYAPYDEGIKEDVFMRGVDGQPYLGWVWPGPCHFPDFFDAKGQAFFTRQLEAHHALVPWDGIWIGGWQGWRVDPCGQGAVSGCGCGVKMVGPRGQALLGPPAREQHNRLAHG